MDKLSKARAALLALAAKVGPASLLEGTVVEVNAADYLADVELEPEVILFECRLRAVVSGNQSIDLLPKVGSKVVLARLDDDDYLVLACDEIENYKITTGQTTIEADTAGINISKGNESLKGILSTLIDEILKIYAPMNAPGFVAIKNRLETLFK